MLQIGERLRLSGHYGLLLISADDADGLLGPQAVDQPALFFCPLGEGISGSDGKPLRSG
jgi:hypothetical protein